MNISWTIFFSNCEQFSTSSWSLFFSLLFAMDQKALLQLTQWVNKLKHFLLTLIQHFELKFISSKVWNFKKCTRSGCSRWLFTIANWNCHEPVSVIIWFYDWQILALLNNFWHFDFFLSGEKVKKERFQS